MRRLDPRASMTFPNPVGLASTKQNYRSDENQAESFGSSQHSTAAVYQMALLYPLNEERHPPLVRPLPIDAVTRRAGAKAVP